MNSPADHRDWKNRPERGFDGLFGAFLLAAVLAAVFLLLLAPEESPVRVVENPVPSAVPPVVAAASVVHPPRPSVPPAKLAALRDQLIETQFHGFFNSLVSDRLPAAKAEERWDAVRARLAGEFSRLARGVALESSISQEQLSDLSLVAGPLVLYTPTETRPEILVPAIRAAIVQYLHADMRDARQEGVETELIEGARELEKQLVEKMREDLEKNLGRAIADKLNQMRELDCATRLKSLETASTTLEQALGQLPEAIAMLEKISVPLKDLLNDFDKQKEKDKKRTTPEITKLATAIRDHRPTIASASALMAKQVTLLKSSMAKFNEHPKIEELVVKALSELDEAHKTAYEAVRGMSTIDSDDINDNIKDSIARAIKAAKRLEQSRAAIQLQLLREQTDRLAEQIAVVSRNTTKLNPVTNELLRESSREAGFFLQTLDRIIKQFDKANESLSRVSDAAKAEWKSARETLTQARQELVEAQQSLGVFKQADGINRFNKAAGVLAANDAKYFEIQKKLGGGESDNPSAQARRTVEGLVKDGKLAEALKDQFVNLYGQRVEKALIRRLEEAAMIRLRAAKADDADTIALVKTEINQLFGPALPKRIDVAVPLTRGIRNRIPPEPAVEVGKVKFDVKSVGGAQGIFDLQAHSSMSAIVDVPLWSPSTSKFAKSTEAPPKQSPLELHLEGIKQQVAAGRREILGAANRAELEETRRLAFAEEMPVVTPEFHPSPALVLGHTTELSPRPVPREYPTLRRSVRFGAIPMLEPGTITIDGDLADWKGVPIFTLEWYVKGTTPATVKVNHQHVQVAYTREGMLFAVDATDSTGVLENGKPFSEFWKNDALEVLLDLKNTKSVKRGEPHIQHFYSLPFGHRLDPKASAFELRVNEKSEVQRIPHSADVLRRVALMTEHGWKLEMFIPNSLLHGTLTPGNLIGFNLVLDTGSDHYWHFASEQRQFKSQAPDTWGDLLLLGTDATIELDDSLVPGQPLRVRLHDRDVNRDMTRAERVSVVIRTASGERETLLLEETGIDTGVYAGLLPTRLNTGEPKRGVLSLDEGEAVTIEYVDAIRAFGERDTRVRLKAIAGSTGLRVQR